MTELRPRAGLALVALLTACAAGPKHHFPEPVAMAEFARPAGAQPPPFAIEGLLSLRPSAATVRIHVINSPDVDLEAFRVHTLPAVSVSLVQADSELLPSAQHPVQSDHPYWEFMPLVGTAWASADKPGWVEAALPFALRERNQNCTHNGVLRFRAGPGGELSDARYQVSSETCKYFKADLWGTIALSLAPSRHHDRSQARSTRLAKLHARLPLRPIEALAEEYPGLHAPRLRPPGDGLSVFGWVVDGVHYRSACFTRHGPYPYCDELPLPSYSLAKGLFAGLVYRYFAERDPDFATTPVTGLVPECRLEDGRWDGVQLRHLSNMSTGLYDSTAYQADEGAPRKIEQFFLPEDNASRIRYACEAYQRREPPGQRPVYHTSDTWLLGVAMNRYLRQSRGPQADIHRDVLLENYLGRMHLSGPAHHTMRSYDQDAQAFTGYGLTFTPDDIARLGGLMNLHAPDFTAARDWPVQPPLRYQRGIWAVNAAKATGCPDPLWIPFLSGYGGNIIALLPNDAVFYKISDDDQFRWLDTVAQLHSIAPWCEEQQP